jgi:hypothetical protein
VSSESTAPDAAPEPVLGPTFSPLARFRPFALASPGFEQAAEQPGRVSGLLLGEAGPVSPFAAVEAEVSDATGGVRLGLATADGDDHLLATYDARRGRVRLELRRAGRSTILRRTRTDLPTRFRFAFALCENRVTALADSGDGWRPLVTARRRVTRHTDFRDPATLSRYHYAWGSGEKGGDVDIARVTAGPFGMTGVRDLHLVQDADGTPYVRDGKVYLTATCAGLGFFQQAHWGVFTLDLADPSRLEQTAHLFFHRDGLLLGDHAGQIVRDGDRWLVAMTSWGDFSPGNVHVRHLATSDDVLHGVHVLASERLDLPTAVSSWDPAMTRIDDRWFVSFVESPSQKPFVFHPAVAVTDDSRWSRGLRLAGAATDLRQCEGPILAQVDGAWRMLASDGHGRAYLVFDLDGHRLGRLDAPYGTNIPHPQLLALPDGGRLMVTFDGTQYAEEVMKYGGHGDVVLLRAD